MRLRRFRVDDLEQARIRIEGQEAEHAMRVLRHTVGDQIMAFDGAGRERRCQITAIGSHWLEADPIAPIHSRPELKDSLTLAVAPPKGDRADWLVEKCAELGVRSIRWIETARGQVNPGEGKLTRWHRKAVEAAKQAGFARVMNIEGPMPLDAAASQMERIYFGDPSPNAQSLLDVLLSNGASENQSIDTIVFIGPEGGFAPDEIAVLKGLGAIGVRLGGSILRIETAAVCVASIWACTMATPYSR